ncbi:hypothetical protein [Halocatena halophila]|uniref:hypothetical protein n=1 Tax=Halocatena halophila TaxID=2814576 RepID=UPI002ED55753
MSNQSDDDGAVSGIKQLLTGVVGKALLFVIALYLLGNLLAYLAIETEMLTYTPFISLAIGLLYSLALIILVIVIVASITAYLQ